MQDAVGLMEVAKPRKVLVEHFPCQKSEPFVGEPDQFGARRGISASHAV